MTERAWFVSDVHLNPADPERTERFDRFLSAWGREDFPLYILGDLFDYWVGPDHVRLDDYRKTLARIEELGIRGRPIRFVFGNRDYLISRQDEAPPGLFAKGESLPIELGGKKVLLLHGDQLCTRDTGHQRYRAVMQSAPLRGLAKRLPLPVKRALALRLRRASVQSIAGKPAEIIRIQPEPLKAIYARGVDVVICGHVHQQENRTVEVAGRSCALYVMKDWRTGMPFLEWAEGRFTFRQALSEA